MSLPEIPDDAVAAVVALNDDDNPTYAAALRHAADEMLAEDDAPQLPDTSTAEFCADLRRMAHEAASA